MEDIQLIALIRDGNAEAFGQVIERYQSPIGAYLYRLTGEYETARDLTQDTFIQAYQSLRKNKHEIQLKAWLYGIATNKALQYRRHKKIITFVPFDDGPNVDLPRRQTSCPRGQRGSARKTQRFRRRCGRRIRPT